MKISLILKDSPDYLFLIRYLGMIQTKKEESYQHLNLISLIYQTKETA